MHLPQIVTASLVGSRLALDRPESRHDARPLLPASHPHRMMGCTKGSPCSQRPESPTLGLGLQPQRR